MSGETITAILLPGDLCMHGMGVKEGVSPTNWVEMQEIIKNVTLEVVDAFPDIPVLFSVGNNDVEYHNMAPSAD